jgi:sugar phosphate isomerase/epimerase
MQKAFGPGSIGVRGLPIPEIVRLAAGNGFDCIQVDLVELARRVTENGQEVVGDLFQHGVTPGFAGLPVAMLDEAEYQRDLELLPDLVQLAADFGITRFTSGVRPGSNELSYDQQFAFYTERLKPIGEILGQHGARLGLEFIAPKTYRSQFANEGIYTMAGILELSEAVGTGNIGLLLDAWHLYTAHETVGDMEGLTADQVVVVHVNDAPPGIPIDEQQDLSRALPLETGVLEIVPFMERLKAIGFNGPVMPEPFSKAVTDLAQTDPFAASKLVGESMDRLWEACDL